MLYWRVYAKEGPGDTRFRTVTLEWGWEAGLTKEQIASLAPDAPRGKQAVTMALHHAKELRDDLDKLINELES